MTARDDLIGGRYRLQTLLGTGGMSTVWAAWDERLQRRVAVKFLRTPIQGDAEEAELAAQRAMREARIAARLHHPYAVAVFDAVEHEGQPCLVMQFVPSITLATLLRTGGPLQVEEAAQVGTQVASALAAAHAAGIVHRDVKPGNILIAEDGTALISDFGIAHALGDATLTATGLVHGTPAFLAPEVARGGEAMYASDVFSLGATLYAALEGTPPFGTDLNSLALLHRVAAAEFLPPVQSGSLTGLVTEMLSADPADRPTMSQAAHRLDELSRAEPAPVTPVPAVDGSSLGTEESSDRPPVAAAPPAASATSAGADASPPSTAPPPPPPPADEGPRRRRWAAPAAAVAALVALAVVLGLIAWPGDLGDPSAADGPSSSAQTESPSPTSSVAASSAQRTVRPPSTAAAPPTTSASRAPRPDPTTAPQPTREPEPTREPTRVSNPPTAVQLADAIRSYYALMPAGTDEAWPRMTAWYQTNHAGGRSGYERFWGRISRVTVTDVAGLPPDRAEATLVYYFKSGRVDTERTAYRLVNEGGQLKISRSDVLSSVSRGAGP